VPCGRREGRAPYIRLAIFWKAYRPVWNSGAFGCGFSVSAGFEDSDEQLAIVNNASASIAISKFFIASSVAREILQP
jgi:hypothetical protein